jgi:hypothetical protein
MLMEFQALQSGETCDQVPDQLQRNEITVGFYIESECLDTLSPCKVSLRVLQEFPELNVVLEPVTGSR